MSGAAADGIATAVASKDYLCFAEHDTGIYDSGNRPRASYRRAVLPWLNKRSSFPPRPRSFENSLLHILSTPPYFKATCVSHV